MKKLIFMAAIAMVLTVFNACTKDELKIPSDDGIAKVSKPDVYLENGYLAFKNMNAVDSVINVLGMMSRQEKDSWEQQMGLKSARSEFDKLFDEYEKLASKDEFLKFKAKYSEQLKFNEMDETDCSIDYPFVCSYYRSVMNYKGILKVGLSLLQYTKESQIIVLDGDMNKLANLNTYSNDKNVIISKSLKSGGRSDVDNLITDFPSFDPSPNSNRWWINNAGDRKLLNELKVNKWVIWNQPVAGGTTYVTKGYRFYLRQYSLKKGLFGWNNYSTVYEFKNPVCKVASGPTLYPLYANGGTSPEVSPDWIWNIYSEETYLTYSGGADLNYITTPLFSMQGDVSCRGFNGVPTFIYDVNHASFP